MSKKVFAGTSKPVNQIEDGKYSAILSQIIMVGHQRFEKNGKEWYSPQIIIGFELPKVTYEADGEVVTSVKSSTYFLSMNPSKNKAFGLRELIDAFHGPDYTPEEQKALEDGAFDIAQYHGKSCLIKIDAVESKGKTYSNITGIEMVSGTDMLIEPKRPLILFTVDDFGDMEEIDKLPFWIQEKIRESKEYKDLGPKRIPTFDEIQSQMAGDAEEIKLEDVPW